ncbi:hypothetical protein [Picosynechococcus sp. PCC 7117]|uniref:hypothetical protein n=1 Tax=Picosynechococcus sp. PCC 7117 TaxID=195498 RepID=UPI00081085B6|nr:hypothetical protein [Picosynechococcus sp. PCC 7117]ANV86386.1 hypothetical protein AWQ22_02245 [Picosynechococcus sp. PCC 7117]
MLENLLKIQLIDILSVDSPEPRSGFSKDKIETLANSFLTVGGNSQPILVQRLDFDSFTVVSGHLEYYAAVRAREINDDFEMINAIIITPENEAQIKHQYDYLNTVQESSATNSLEHSLNKNEIANLEKNLLAHLQDQLKFEVSRLENNLSRNLEQKFDGVKILVPRDEDHLEAFNVSDFKILVDKLGSAGFTGKKGQKMATAIIQERKKSRFSSLGEIINRVRLQNKNRAITETSMVKILDAWNRFIDVEETK